MPRADSSVSMLVVAAALALGIGYFVPEILSQSGQGIAKAETPKLAQSKVAPKTQWAASAPGRVEPIGRRDPHLGPGAGAHHGRAGWRQRQGDRRRSAAALRRRGAGGARACCRAEAAARKRDRDNEGVGKAAQDRRTAEDNLANGERWLAYAREDLDRALKLRRSGTASAADADKARAEVTKASEYLEQARSVLRKATAGNGPAPTRLEAALAAARAELSLAEATLERARIRAPSKGTVLQVNARVGETAAPSPENALVVLGDVSALRVRAEFEERDIGKVHLGQAAVVRSDAFHGKDFEGTVSSLARALGPSRLGQRGPRRPTDIDVLEVMIDLGGQPPLLPGMRVDVFLKAALPQPPAALSGGPRRT